MGRRKYETAADLEEVSMVQILIRGAWWDTRHVWAKRKVGLNFTPHNQVRTIRVVISINSFRTT